MIVLEGGNYYDESSWTLPEFLELMIHRQFELESMFQTSAAHSLGGIHVSFIWELSNQTTSKQFLEFMAIEQLWQL